MNIESLALRKLLSEPNLEIYSQMHSSYFTGAFRTIFKSISEYYAKYGKIPTLEGLKITTRNMSSLITISSLELVSVPNEDWDILLDSLVDNYAQTQVLEKLSEFVENVSLLNSEAIKENLSKIVLDLDNEIDKGNKSFTASHINVFKPLEEQTPRTPIGLNEFDAQVGGAFAEKLYIPGGRRGTGKSFLCANIIAKQFQQGNTSAYFTIEMTAQEVFDRIISILASVSPSKLEKQTLNSEEILKVIKTKCNMYIDSEKVYSDYVEGKLGIYDLEHVLNKTCRLKKEQIVIVDDRALSLTTIDLELQKLKSKFGDSLQVVVIDYLNQITLDGKSNRDMYDWTYQIQIAKTLKNFARKYGVCVICPIQLDDNNAVRYAKGILDSPDLVWSCDWDKTESKMYFTILKDRFVGLEEGSKMSFNVNVESMEIMPDLVFKPVNEVPNDIPF